MRIKSDNVWGVPGGLEAQRADLWEVDLRPVSSVVNNPGGVSTTALYNLLLDEIPSGEALTAYPYRLTLPELTIEPRQVSADVHARNLPGYDAPVGLTRLEFLHEAKTQAKGRAIYSLMEAWRLLGLAGQRLNGIVILPLVSSRAKPAFKVDLPIRMLRGTEDGEGLVPSAVYTLEGAWCSDLQISDLDQSSGSNVLRITATLQCYAITQDKGRTVSSVGADAVPVSVRETTTPAPGRKGAGQFFDRPAEPRASNFET